MQPLPAQRIARSRCRIRRCRPSPSLLPDLCPPIPLLRLPAQAVNVILKKGRGPPLSLEERLNEKDRQERQQQEVRSSRPAGCGWLAVPALLWGWVALACWGLGGFGLLGWRWWRQQGVVSEQQRQRRSNDNHPLMLHSAIH